VLDRASSFSHPEVVALLQNGFVPVAIDQAYHRRQKDNEGRFYRKIADAGPRSAGDGSPTTQGHYVATPGGEFLGYSNHRDVSRLLALLQDSLVRFEPDSTEPLEEGDPDRRYVYGPPEGGLVVRVFTRILGGYGEPTNSRQAIFQQATGRDNLWIRRDEHEELARGIMPESLLVRLARFHLVDNTRGEPPMWKADEIRSARCTVDDGVIRGRIHLATDSGDRTFEAELLGRLEVSENTVNRFDLVARGDFLGEGRYTRGAPEGKFPLGVAFRLAGGDDPADDIPPQGSRGWLAGYLE